MNIVHVVILGIVEGLTEFLPISSTFHLIFASKILGLAQTDFTKLFEVFIQAGAILAVLSLYLKTYLNDREILKKTIVAFIPTAVVGLLLYKVIKNIFFNSNILMLSVFMLVGLIFIVYEYAIKKNKVQLTRDLTSFTYKEALCIGLMQSLAVLPGVSRAGAVIIAMMFLKFKRFEAAKFSFLLSVPTIVAASALDAIKMRSIIFSSSGNEVALLVGFVISFISAFFVVKWFIGFLQKHTLDIFGIYRIIIGLLLILLGVK